MTVGLGHILNLGHDGAGLRGWMDPRGQRVPVVVPAVAAEAGDVAALNQGLAVEARGLADWPLREDRLTVLEPERDRLAVGSHCDSCAEVAIERVVSDQPAGGRPRHRGAAVQRSLPALLGMLHSGLKRCVCAGGGCELIVELLQLTLLIGRRRLDARR